MQNEGDWVELGTARGFIMSAALKYHKEKWNQGSKNLWLVDTFSPFHINPATGIQHESGQKMEEYCDDLDLVKEHFNETNSLLAKKIFENFNAEMLNFLQICPKEMINKLENPISLKSPIKEVI